MRNRQERSLAEASKAELAKSGIFDEPIVTEIRWAQPFYAAEPYHQDYYKKNPSHYKRYRVGSGREGFLNPSGASDLSKPPKSQKETSR